eukprot:scaffold119260_cov45-Phaeocystis_antarctica.AAC.2
MGAQLTDPRQPLSAGARGAQRGRVQLAARGNASHHAGARTRQLGQRGAWGTRAEALLVDAALGARLAQAAARSAHRAAPLGPG